MPMRVEIEDLMGELRALVFEMEALLQEGGAGLRERLGDTGSALENNLAEAKSKLNQLEREARTKLRHTARTVDRYAHDNPWHMTAAGLTTGLLLGLALGIAIASRETR